MTKPSFNSYIADELAHKVVVLSKALYEAEKTINLLEKENNTLKQLSDYCPENTAIDNEADMVVHLEFCDNNQKNQSFVVDKPIR